ncbi:MAG: amidohydrolase family protein [Myxococcota bacterium]|nr:amidohydrolase [Myxococcales bacterium]
MAAAIFDRFQVIDIDTHLTEPPDTWTARLASKYGDRIPHIRQIDGKDLWFAGDQPVGMPGAYSMAGHDGTPPEFRSGYAEIPKAMYDAKARLAFMDEEKIHAQVLYPNVGGFGSGGFRKLGDPQLMLDCVSAYNDFLVDWCSADPHRLLGVAAMPFWDVDASVREIERCAGLGFRAILMCNQPQDHGQPLLRDKHWDRFWGAAQANDMTVSFHVGGGDFTDVSTDPANIGFKTNFARASVMAFIDNARSISDVIMGGVPHRFPRLQMVSVESGVGWIPFVVEGLDWQWKNNGVRKEHPEYDLLPSEYFRRQIYASFWFEEGGLADAIARFPDNILFETDYPHPTCQAPGPASAGTHPRLYAERALAGLPDATLQKVLHDTAARLYRL